MPEFNSITELREYLPKARAALEMKVEASALEIIDMAKQISSALGEVSFTELEDVIIREFTKKIKEPMIIDGKMQ